MSETSDDITWWLRHHEDCGCHEAAVEIDRLRAEVESLRTEVYEKRDYIIECDDEARTLRARVERLKRAVVRMYRYSFVDHWPARYRGVLRALRKTMAEHTALRARVEAMEGVVEAATEVARYSGMDWETVAFATAHQRLVAALEEVVEAAREVSDE